MRAPTTEFTDAQKLLARCPEVKAYTKAPDDWNARCKANKSLDAQKRRIKDLDMEVRKSFYVPKTLCLDPQIVASKDPQLARTKSGPVEWRSRSDIGKEAFNVAYEKLPFHWQEEVEARVTNSAQVKAGNQYTLGRFAQYYPKKDADRSFLEPVTEEEADLAFKHTGFTFNREEMMLVQAYPLVMEEEQQGLRINVHSNNGLPVMKTWADMEARRRCLKMAVKTRQEIVAAATLGYAQNGGVAKWKRLKEKESPWEVAVVGKTKTDNYKLDKVWEEKLRFYNNLPRHIQLNIQVAAQPLLSVKKNILTGEQVHNSSGISLMKGGAHKLVGKLQQQLDDNGYAYVTQGDDTWIVVQGPKGSLRFFALDGNSFDLTQDSMVTKNLHYRVHEPLSLIDKPAADLWLSYMRGRLTVLTSSLVRYMRHGGPSGGLLQSEVNNMLEDVAVMRVIRGWMNLGINCTEQDIANLVEHVGDTLGLSLRIEQYSEVSAGGIAGALAHQPFTFVGYTFYSVDGEEVLAHCDLPRTMASIPFPVSTWAKKGREFDCSEAVRLSSMSLNMGIPTTELIPAFAAYRLHCKELLEECIEKYPQTIDTRYDFFTGDNPIASHNAEPTLVGMLNAVMRPPIDLWELPEDEPILEDRGGDPVDWEAVPMPESWADRMDFTDELERLALGIPEPPKASQVKYLPYRYKGDTAPVTTTHSASDKNDGRPPPTVVWGPDKKARPKRQKRTRTVRFARVGPDDAAARYQDELDELSEAEEQNYADEHEDGHGEEVSEVVADNILNQNAWASRRSRLPRGGR